MTKQDIVIQISNDTGIIQEDVREVFQHFLDQLRESLANNHVIELRDFGVFRVVMRASRVGRNPNQPTHEVTIPTRAVVKFKAGKNLKHKASQLSHALAAGKPSAPPILETAWQVSS